MSGKGKIMKGAERERERKSMYVECRCVEGTLRGRRQVCIDEERSLYRGDRGSCTENREGDGGREGGSDVWEWERSFCGDGRRKG